MWNGQFSHDRALAMAVSILRKTQTQSEAIQQSFQRSFGRAATKQELQQVLAHWRRMSQFHANKKPKKQKYPKEVVRQAVEEMNGKPFTFAETLDYDTFVPDLKPWQVDANTRAFADICHVLLNTNEFLFVR